jgi:hypothetical protein
VEPVTKIFQFLYGNIIAASVVEFFAQSVSVKGFLIMMAPE